MKPKPQLLPKPAIGGPLPARIARLGSRRGVGLAVVLTGVLLTMAPAARGGTIAYQLPSPLSGNQEYDGPIGLDFDVLAPIVITKLGAFDSEQNGMKRDIRVYIFDRDNTASPVAGPIHLMPGDDGTLVGAFRFKPLATPLNLPAGFHGSIVAENYGVGEPLRNSFGSVPPFSTLDDGGCLIQFVGAARYQSPVIFGVFPATVDGGPVNRHHGGTFEFESAPANPVVTGQPQSQTVADSGDVSFSVTATGAAPLTYQWQFNGADLSLETDATLMQFGVSSANAGLYRVKVTDANGISVCSAPANLIVAPAAMNLVYDPATISGGTPEGTASGIGLFFDVVVGTSIDVTQLGTVLFESDLTTNLITVQLFDAASAAVLATVTFNSADMPSPVASSPPLYLFLKSLSAPLSLGPGSYAIALFGSGPTANYIRSPAGTTINTGGGAIRHVGSRYNNVAGPGVLPDGADGTGITYLAATLTMTVSGAPVITHQPQGGTFAPGATVTLSVQAGGSLPLSYLWRKGNSAVAGGTNASLSIPNLGVLQTGDYTVAVSNNFGSVTSAVATVSVAGSPTVGIHLYAGITLEGTVGLHYRIEFLDALDPPDAWQPLQDIPSLVVSPYVFYDPTPATHPARLYRVLLIP